MTVETYYRDVQDGSLLRRSENGYEVLWPSGRWASYEPSYECFLHLEELPVGEAQAAIENFLARNA